MRIMNIAGVMAVLGLAAVALACSSDAGESIDTGRPSERDVSLVTEVLETEIRAPDVVDMVYVWSGGL